MMDQQPRRKAGMIGVGLDHKDGHVRVTQGKNFRIVLGSEETHERMTEICVKINEKLDRRGRQLDEVSPGEFGDLVKEAGAS